MEFNNLKLRYSGSVSWLVVLIFSFVDSSHCQLLAMFCFLLLEKLIEFFTRSEPVLVLVEKYMENRQSSSFQIAPL